MDHNDIYTERDEVLHIVSQIPSKIIQWGISVGLAILLIILILSNFIQYPNFVIVQANLVSDEKPFKDIWSNHGNIIYHEYVKDAAKVMKGDCILVKKDLKTNTFDVTFSKMNGTYYSMLDWKSNRHISWIIPNKFEYIGILKIPIENYKDVKIGQEVRFVIKEYPETEFGYIRGKIYNIIPVPIDGYYQAKVKFPNSVRTNTGFVIPNNPFYAGMGQIIIENTSVLNRLLRLLFT